MPPPGPPPTPAVAPSPGGASALPPADRVLDRDGDGQPDHWIHLQNGQVAREHFDENGDSRPDRAVWRDPVTGHEQRVEEDRNGDGTADLIAEYVYANGQRVARVAADGTTTYYHNNHLGTPRVITDESGQVVHSGRFKYG